MEDRNPHNLCTCNFFNYLIMDLCFILLLIHFFRIDVIDKCFGHDTVEEIIDALVSILNCQVMSS